MSNTQEIEINNMMYDETLSSINKIKTLLKFFNSRVRFYNIEIHLLTHQILKLKKDIYIYYDILDEYKKDLDKQLKVDVLMCKICYTELSNCILEPCRHLVCCYDCVEKLQDNKCPMCRTEIENQYKIFF